MHWGVVESSFWKIALQTSSVVALHLKNLHRSKSMHQLSDRPDSFQVSSTPPLRKSDRPKRSQNYLVSLLRRCFPSVSSLNARRKMKRLDEFATQFQHRICRAFCSFTRFALTYTHGRAETTSPRLTTPSETTTAVIPPWASIAA